MNGLLGHEVVEAISYPYSKTSEQSTSGTKGNTVSFPSESPTGPTANTEGYMWTVTLIVHKHIYVVWSSVIKWRNRVIAHLGEYILN